MGKTKWRLNREGHYKKAMEGTTVFQTGNSGIRKHLRYYEKDTTLISHFKPVCGVQDKNGTRAR